MKHIRTFIACLLSLANYKKQKAEHSNIAFDLQLFAGEKTEEATPKRKEEARKKGQVAKSMEVNSVFILVAAFLTLQMVGSFIYDELTNYMRFIFSNFPQHDVTIQDTTRLFMGFGMVFLKTTMPVMGIILMVALLVNFLQVGFHFSTEPLMPNFGKLDPIKGFTRLFSKRSLVEMGKALVKVVVIGYFIYRFMMREATDVPSLISADLIDSLKYTGSLIVDLAFQVSAVLIVLAAIDYFYQWWEHNESLKMSKQEIKEEYKQTEGDPLIKGKIKERQRAMAMRRMMQDVPKADVIVTNPTHYAVALKYEKEMSAPMILAKGQDFVAQKIKEIAKENKVVIVENKTLARTLYATTNIGDVVPPELYQAVAEVLAYVYRLKKRLS